MDKFDTILKKYETDMPIATRFPPEPNGFLHLGHAKAAYINFNLAKHAGGICYLRLDDTNPKKEKHDYINSIIEDIAWLEHKPYKITYTSDYFEQIFHHTIDLIKSGNAYVCELNEEEIRKFRRNNKNSPFRDRNFEESLKLFLEMRDGDHKENTMCLRLKCSSPTDNPNMKDPVIYRIIFDPHPRTGTLWKIYPTYDYSHPIVDSIENITHSLCSIEFRIRNELYSYVPKILGIYGAPQIEYSRLNMTHTVLSKRKLTELIDKQVVAAWDDPRIPTIRGLRRRGYTPDAINNFCNKIGISIGISGKKLLCAVLEDCLRKDLETKAKRIFGIINPLLVRIVNANAQASRNVIIPNYPIQEGNPNRCIRLGEELYIEKDDFRTTDDPNFYRLAPGKIVRLKHLGLVRCISFDETNDEIICVNIELLPDTFKPDSRIKGTIGWVSKIDHIIVTIREYDHLFPEFCDKNNLIHNENTLKTYTILTESSLLGAKAFDKYQLERIGYFCVDPDSTDNIIMNYTIPLRQNKNK